MFIINLVDSFSSVNFGIWNSAISTASVLMQEFNVRSYFYFKPGKNDNVPTELAEVCFPFTDLEGILKKGVNTPKNTLFISHGCWQFPTKAGFLATKQGYKWIFVPHGMLEPWSMQQKYWKKLLYFNLFEKQYIKKASVVRAVSEPEKKNLEKILYKKVVHIANGIPEVSFDVDKPSNKTIFLFMARLHYKKGIIPLLEAWINSSLFHHQHFELLIVGPDDGELSKIKYLLVQYPTANFKYIGAVYGQEKEVLLKTSHFYILPSFSEGFPTSVIEAMQNGAIPLISQGCNFPEVFQNNLGIEITPEKSSIEKGLEEAIKLDPSLRKTLALKNKAFVKSHYTISAIAHQQYALYQTLLNIS